MTLRLVAAGFGAAAVGRPAAVGELRTLQKCEGAVHRLIESGVHGRGVGRTRKPQATRVRLRENIVLRIAYLLLRVSAACSKYSLIIRA